MVKKKYLTTLSVVIVSVLLGALFYNNVAFATREVEYNLYFGDLHTHTSYSDGRGTPEDAFAAAKAAGADFMATTDHHSMLTAEEWMNTLQWAEEYTSADFVAMAGYEYGMAGIGEINVFNTADIPLVEQKLWGCYWNGTRKEALPTFYDWLSQQLGAIGHWNHPTEYVGPTNENFVNYAYWTEARDLSMGIIELWNDVNYEASYIMALDAGWHVMPAANSDTHSEDWISGSELRTVLFAPSLTPTDLYEAMTASRGYATQDKNLCIYYTLNGEIMGSVLSSSTSIYTASIHIEDPDDNPSDAITLVEIVSDGGNVVASLPTNDTTVDWTVTLSSETASYYYVRVTTASDVSGGEGVTAWTAPVWTGL